MKESFNREKRLVPEQDQVKSTKYTSETNKKSRVDLKYRMCTQVEVQANRIDGRVIDKVKKEVILIEMSCPWMENPQMKTEEKMRKYGPLRWEIKQQYSGYKVSQYNIILNVLSGYSKHVRKSIKCLIGGRSY